MIKILKAILMIAISYHSAGTAAALSANEVIKLAEKGKGAGIEGFQANLHIVANESGNTSERWLELKVGGDTDDYVNQSVVEFAKPRKYKGQMMLMSKGNMWFIRRGLSKPVPISPRQRMMGGAANGDIATTNYISYYDHKILREDTIDGIGYYVLELTATNRLATYSRIVYWVSKKKFKGEKAEFYTASGKLFKRAEFSYDNTLMVDGKEMPFISSMTIHDEIQKGDTTVMTYKDVSLEKFPASEFNVNLLMR